MTLLELLVGLATAVILAGICAKVIHLGIVTYNYAARQNTSLVRMRQALAGDGAHSGVLGDSRSAYSLSGVSASTVAVLSSSSAVVTSFYVTGGRLYRTKSAVSFIQADAMTALTLNYYMSTGGMISSTTVVASATMMTALVTIGSGTTSAQKPYSLFSGAQLRNHP